MLQGLVCPLSALEGDRSRRTFFRCRPVFAAVSGATARSFVGQGFAAIPRLISAVTSSVFACREKLTVTRQNVEPLEIPKTNNECRQ